MVKIHALWIKSSTAILAWKIFDLVDKLLSVFSVKLIHLIAGVGIEPTVIFGVSEASYRCLFPRENCPKPYIPGSVTVM